MLKKLLIEQFVIIDRMEREFESGLTILTGETGAGKSILLDAMGLLWGDDSDEGSIRQGAAQSVIQGWFDAPANNFVWGIFEELNIPADKKDGNFTIRRLVNLAADDDITINDTTVALADLKRIGPCLGEIHGQFANQSLLDPANQMNLLDISGNFPPEVFKNVASALHDVQRLTRELEEENAFIAKHKMELPVIEGIVKRFDDLGMKEGFVEEVAVEYKRLLTAKETSEAFQEMLSQLIATNGAVRALSAAKNIIDTNKNMDRAKVGELDGMLTLALSTARDAVNEMHRLAPDYDIDTRPLIRYRDILSSLRDLAKEAKVGLDGLFPFYDALATKMRRLQNGRDKVRELDEQLTAAKDNYRHHARILTQHRTRAGEALSEAITAELPPLKLPRAQFKVKVEELAHLPWTERGINQITFTARMNPGQEFTPVSETASGGELARLILALKVVLQKVVAIPTLVFDEVDTGIGGAAAAAVGERIAQLADTTQVFVITHSPQVASRHDHHLHVSKTSDGTTTRSVVRSLELEETIDEISRMLSGESLTPESRAAAKSLIDEARTAAKARRGQAAHA